MRKLIWCCLTAGLLAAGSFLALAHYALRYPNSLVGRSMQVIAEASVAMQPLSGLTSLAVRTSQANAPAGAIEECIPDEPRPVAPEPKEFKQVSPVADRAFEMEAAPIVIGEDDPMPREEMAPCHGALPIEQGQEMPATAIVMPYCRDDEDQPVAPPTMPSADAGFEAVDDTVLDGDDEKSGACGKDAEHSVFKEWMKLFEEGKEGKADKSPVVEELPAPKEEEPQAEPKCQEDSHLHEHYSGCPRVTCPYTGKSYPSGKGKEESSEEPKPHGKKRHSGKGCKSKEECPRTEGVDTMEYRKSDAGLNEYGPGPLH